MPPVSHPKVLFPCKQKPLERALTAGCPLTPALLAGDEQGDGLPAPRASLLLSAVKIAAKRFCNKEPSGTELTRVLSGTSRWLPVGGLLLLQTVIGFMHLSTIHHPHIT